MKMGEILNLGLLANHCVLYVMGICYSKNSNLWKQLSTDCETQLKTFHLTTFVKCKVF